MLAANAQDARPMIAGYQPPARSADAERLARRFDLAVADPSPVALSALREVAVAFVRDLHARGLPPEAVIVTLKALLRGHGGFRSVPSLRVEQEAYETQRQPTVYARLFRWTVEAYFAIPARPDRT